MPTDDERREVAARLRALDVFEFDEGDYIDQGDIENTLGVINVDGAWCEAEGVMRLADIIEPEERTCRDVSGYPDGFECSECGCLLDVYGIESQPTMWVKGMTIAPSFCPTCGGKVVSE